MTHVHRYWLIARGELGYVGMYECEDCHRRCMDHLANGPADGLYVGNAVPLIGAGYRAYSPTMPRPSVAMDAQTRVDDRIKAEEKVAIILEENAETLALLAIMLKRRGMDQATAEMTLRKVGWWRA